MQFSLTGNIRRIRRKSLIGQLVLFCLGLQVLLFASFTCFDLPTATHTNLARYINVSLQAGISYFPPHVQAQVLERFPVLQLRMPDVRYSPYVPIAPAAIFLGYVLGLPLGFFSAIGFVVVALIGPYVGLLPVAAGGGLDYYKQATFGYLIGMVFAAWFAGRITMSENNSLRQLAVIVGGLTILHVVGLIYLVGSSLGILLLQGENSYMQWQPWLAESIRNYSWYALPYDALFTLGAVGIGFPFRWLTEVLTAPDIAMRGRGTYVPVEYAGALDEEAQDELDRTRAMDLDMVGDGYDDYEENVDDELDAADAELEEEEVGSAY